MHSANPFRVQTLFNVLIPGLSLRFNPGLKLANAFGVNAGAEISERLRRLHLERNKAMNEFSLSQRLTAEFLETPSQSGDRPHCTPLGFSVRLTPALLLHERLVSCCC